MGYNSGADKSGKPNYKKNPQTSAENNVSNQDKNPGAENGFTPPLLNSISKQITDLLERSNANKNELIDCISYVQGILEKRIVQTDQTKSQLLTDALNKNITHTRNLLQQTCEVILNGFSQKFLDIKNPNSLMNNVNNLSKSQRKFNDSLNERVSAIENDATNLTEVVDKFSKSQKTFNEDLSGRLSTLEKDVKDVSKNTEMVQSLPGKIEELTDILSDKGLQFKAELPTVNHEEETYAQMAEYGEKILQQLAIAARWYARKLPELEKHEATMQNLMAEHEKEKVRLRQEGEDSGRKKVIKELLERYGEKIHSLIEPDENADERLKILADFLKNQGVTAVHKMYQEIYITDDTRMENEPYIEGIADLHDEKIFITSPAYTFDGKIFRASYMKNDEFLAAHKAELDSTAATEETSNEDKNADNTEPAQEG